MAKKKGGRHPVVRSLKLAQKLYLNAESQAASGDCEYAVESLMDASAHEAIAENALATGGHKRHALQSEADYVTRGDAMSTVMRLCVRRRKPKFDPEEGMTRAEWKKSEEDWARQWQKLGLEGLTKTKRRRRTRRRR